MKKIASLTVAAMVGLGLTGCADPYANAVLEMSISGPSNVVGEEIELAITIAGVDAEKQIVVQQRVDSGEWSNVEIKDLQPEETVLSIKDTIDPGNTLEYRALLLNPAGVDPRAEVGSGIMNQVTLEEFVSENLELALDLTNKPSKENYLFDGDQIQVRATSAMPNSEGLDINLSLSYLGGASISLGEDLGLGIRDIQWAVLTDETTAEKGQLVLEALVSGTSGIAKKAVALDVVLTNPLKAFSDTATEANALSSNSKRRALLLDQAGDIFVDTGSKSWVDGSNVNFVFNDPFIGEIVKFEPEMKYQVPMACAPNGNVNAETMPGRSFLIEAELGGYDFNETVFGYFDGEKLAFSTAWKFCMG